MSFNSINTSINVSRTHPLAMPNQMFLNQCFPLDVVRTSVIKSNGHTGLLIKMDSGMSKLNKL